MTKSQQDDTAQYAWVPSESVVERSRLLTAMRRWGYESIEELNRSAVADPERFWRAVVDDLEITFDAPFEKVRDESDGKPFPRWFTGGHLNVANLCAHRHAVGQLVDKTAVIYEGDSGQRRKLTYAELDRAVRRFAANLTQLGVVRGDRVVLFVPAVPEAVVAFLAIAMIGAISVRHSPGTHRMRWPPGCRTPRRSC